MSDFAPPITVSGDVQGLPLGSQLVTALQGRPVSSAAPSSAQVLTWDDSSKQWTPTSPPGTQIAYNTISGNVTVTGLASSTSSTVISSTSKTYDGTNVMLEFFSPVVITPSVAGGSITFGLYEGATFIGEMGILVTPAAANMKSPILLRYVFGPAAGSHSYTIGAWVSSTTGTPTVETGTIPTYLRITKT